MQNKSKNNIKATIYTTTGFPYGMAAENFIRQVVLGLTNFGIPLNVVRMCGVNQRNSATNDTGISVSNMFLNKKLPGFLSIINIFFLPFIIPFSLMTNKIKYGTNVVLLYGVSFAYWGAPLIFFCKIFGIKVYSFETERYIRKYFGVEWYKFPKWMAYKLQYTFFDSYLDGKISLSDFLVKESIKYGLNPKKNIAIPHFIDTDFFLKKHIVPDPNYFTIGFSGAMYSLNGIYVLINAFKLALKEYSNFRLLLIGTTHFKEKDVFNDALKDIREYIIFPGMVSVKDVPNYLGQCNVLVNPREKSVLSDSGFPTKIGEYLSTSKPVVTTNTGDLKNFFEDKRDIFYFESGDTERLKDLLIYIYNNESTSMQVATNGYKKAKKHLNYIESSKKLIDFIAL